MAAVLLIDQAQLEDRISAITLMRLYDDDNDGVADVDAVNGLIADGSSKVLEWLGPVYDVAILSAVQQNAVVRLVKDVCQAYAAQRHPEFMRGVDGYKAMAQAEKELENLRKGLTNLGTKDPPEPAANQGGDVDSGDPNDQTPRDKLFLDGTGDY